MKDNGGTAFPADRVEVWGGEQGEIISDIGLSKRDWFAGLALQGFCAGLQRGDNADALPELCYELADAMLRERAK